MTKSKTRRQRDRAAPPRAARQTGGGRAARPGQRVRRSASPAAIGITALLALLAAAALIAAGGGIPSPTAPPAVPDAPTPAAADASAAEAADSGSAVAEPGTPDALSALVSCGGVPCPSKGEDGAPVTIIEVSDFTCSHCRDFNVMSEPVIDANYVDVGKARYVAHVFGFNDQSRAISAAALCAHEQGQYFPFQQLAFNAQGTQPSPQNFSEWAEAIGLDTTSFDACVREGRYDAQVLASTNEALAAGVTGTPSFIVNGSLTEGNPPLGEFSAQIDAALAAAGETS